MHPLVDFAISFAVSYTVGTACVIAFASFLWGWVALVLGICIGCTVGALAVPVAHAALGAATVGATKAVGFARGMFNRFA